MQNLLRSKLGWVALAGIIIVLAFFFANPGPPRTIMLATGAPGGAYDAFGRQLAARLEREGLTVMLRETQGSVENLGLLADQESGVSMALVQSGIAAEEAGTDLRSLGALFHEPLWIFTRRNSGLASLRDLRGQRVAIGPEGSGSRPLAQQVMQLTGVADAVQIDGRGGEAAYDALRAGDVDVAMFVASPQSPFIRKLLASPELEFHGLQRPRAYEAALPRLAAVEIGEGQLDIPRNIPDRDLTLLSAMVTLVVNERFYSGLAPLVLEAARDVLRHGGALERPGSFPAPRPVDFRLLREAEHYHRAGLPLLLRILPFWVATMSVRIALLIVPLMVLLIPLFRVAPPLYQWRTRRKIFHWYSYLREIDQHLRSGVSGSTLEADWKRLQELQHEVSGVKVPLSYTDELYELHLHIDWVIQRLERIRAGAAEGRG